MNVELRMAPLFPAFTLDSLKANGLRGIDEVEALLQTYRDLSLDSLVGMIHDEIQELLSCDIGERVVGAWVAYGNVLEAASEIGGSEYLVFQPHVLESKHETEIEVFVNSVRTTGIPVGLTLWIQFEAGRLSLRHRRIMALHTGRLKTRAKLEIWHKTVLQRDILEPIELAGTVHFGHGIPLTLDELGRLRGAQLSRPAADQR